MNYLYYGDNLDVLRRYVKDETVDLIYLDPPFKSNHLKNWWNCSREGGQCIVTAVRNPKWKCRINLPVQCA